MDLASSFQCGWAAVHLVGLVAASLVRAYAGSMIERPLQALFLVSLAAVGVATVAGSQLNWSLWTLSAATMGVMIVVVVADFHQSQPELHG